MDGVDVENAITRDRIRAALSRYENKPGDSFENGTVRAVNADGSYEVLLDGDVQPRTCSAYATAGAGDRVLVCIMANGRCVAVARLEGTESVFAKPVISTFEPTASGQWAFEIRNDTVLTDTFYTASRTDNGTQVMFGVGAGGTNHGVYSNVLKKWMVYADDSSTYLQANTNIYMTAPSAGLSARAYGVNKVLWSGAYLMSPGHTVTLSEAASAQPHGIVLVWSEYINNNAANSGWSYFFIPKTFTSLGITGGTNCSSTHYGNSYLMSKYVYVGNTTIGGNALNNDYADNERFALRYVIGV